MQKRSKNILAIMLAASVMSGTWSLPTMAADFSSEEILEVEENSGGEKDVSQEADNLEIKDQESDSEEEIFTEDNNLEEPDDIEENEEISQEVGIQEESVATYDENDGQSVDIGAPVEDFSDTEDVGDQTAGSYGVKVAGIWVTPENKDDILGDGTVSYDAEKHKLTLNNAHISSMDKSNIDVVGFIYFYLRGTDGETAESATLELKGNNIIDIKKEDKQNISTYIFSVGNLTITGDGSLSVRNTDYNSFVYAESLVIEKVKLDCEWKYYNENVPRKGIEADENIEIRDKAKVRLENGRIQQGKGTSGNLVISDSTVTCGGEINTYKCSILNHSGVKVDTGEIFALKGMEIKDSNVETYAEKRWGIGFRFYNSDEDQKVSLDIINSKVKVSANTCAFYLANCDMSVKNSIVETDGEVEYSIDAYSASVKPNLNIEDSWVDGSGKFDVADRKISNSIVFEENNGTVTGNAVITDNVEVRKDHILTISKPATLTVPSDLTLTNNGAMNASCNAIKGIVTGTEPVYTHGQLTQWVNDKKSHWKECIDCGTKFQETAHAYGSWKTYRKPSVGVAGEREHICKVCNYAESGTIPALQVLTLNIKGGKKAISLNWNKMSGADGYKVYGTECGKKSQLKKTVSKNTLKWTEKKLKAGTYYKYYVVAYKKVNGKETVLAKSDVMHVATAGKGYGYAKKISLKSTSLTLKKGKSAYIKASLVSTNKKYNKKIQEHIPRIRFTSSDQAVATVNSKGKVTARAKGTCYIYCYGLNGVSRKVKITVK